MNFHESSFCNLSTFFQVCQSNTKKKSNRIQNGTKKKKKPSKQQEEEEDEDGGFFENDFFDDAFDENDYETQTEATEATYTEDDDNQLPDHMFSNYDDFYYYDDDDVDAKAKGRKRRALSSPSKPKCVPCETKNKKQRPTPEQFKKHLRWFVEDNPGETCPVAGQAAYRDCLRLAELDDTDDG